VEISRWRQPPVSGHPANRPGGAVEIREVNLSAAPSGADDLAGPTGGWRHRLISGGPPGHKTSSSGYSISKNSRVSKGRGFLVFSNAPSFKSTTCADFRPVQRVTLAARETFRPPLIRQFL